MPIVRALLRSPSALLLSVAAVLALHVQPAHAQQQCSSTDFTLDFGTADSGGRAASAPLPISCQPDYQGRTTYYQICIYFNLGNWSAGQPTRRMTNYNGSYLNYDLFADPAHTSLIGPPGSSPTFQIQIADPPATTQTVNVPIYGWVYPGQAVPATIRFQEQGVTGVLRYRYSYSGYPVSTDCTTGGTGGGTSTVGAAGIYTYFADSCGVTATDIDFGAVPPPQSTLREQGTIRVQCAPGTVWKVALDNGRYYDGTMRRMSGPGGYVRYQLYQNAANSQVWGADDTSMVTGTTNSAGNAASLTVYATVPPQPDAAAGSYVDTIVVTLYY